MSWGVLPWVYPVWDSLGVLDLGGYFLPILGKFSTIISSSIFPWPFFLSSPSGTPMTQMLGCLTLSQRSLKLSSFLLIPFSLFLFGTLWVSWGESNGNPLQYYLCDYFLPHFREVFNYYLLKYFLMVFLFVLFFWDSYNLNVGAFHIVLEV